MDKDISKKVDISIIIINYKDYEMTERCVDSILKHTSSSNFEIVIVDNSSDQTKAANFQSKYQSAILIANEDNKGFSAANNQALKVIKGKYLLFLNNDTLFIEDTLQRVYKLSNEIKSPSFIGCKLLNGDLSHQESISDFDTLGNVLGESIFLYKIFPNIRFFNKYFLNRKEFNKQIEVDIIKGAFIFSQTEHIKRMGGFDENFYFYGEEVDLCHRFKMEGGKIFYLPTTSIVHIGRATSMKNLQFKFINQSKAKLKIYYKYHNGLELYSMILFHYMGILLRIPLYIIFGVLKFEKLSILKSYYYFRTLFINPTKS